MKTRWIARVGYTLTVDLPVQTNQTPSMWEHTTMANPNKQFKSRIKWCAFRTTYLQSLAEEWSVTVPSFWESTHFRLQPRTDQWQWTQPSQIRISRRENEVMVDRCNVCIQSVTCTGLRVQTFCNLLGACCSGPGPGAPAAETLTLTA